MSRFEVKAGDADALGRLHGTGNAALDEGKAQVRPPSYVPSPSCSICPCPQPSPSCPCPRPLPLALSLLPSPSCPLPLGLSLLPLPLPSLCSSGASCTHAAGARLRRRANAHAHRGGPAPGRAHPLRPPPRRQPDGGAYLQSRRQGRGSPARSLSARRPAPAAHRPPPAALWLVSPMHSSTLHAGTRPPGRRR